MDLKFTLCTMLLMIGLTTGLRLQDQIASETNNNQENRVSVVAAPEKEDGELLDTNEHSYWGHHHHRYPHYRQFGYGGFGGYGGYGGYGAYGNYLGYGGYGGYGGYHGYPHYGHHHHHHGFGHHGFGRRHGFFF